MRTWLKIICFTTLFSIFITGSLPAHVCYMELEVLRRHGEPTEDEDFSFEHPFVVPDRIAKSRAIFAYLSRNDVDVYQYTVPDGLPGVFIAMGLPPACAVYRNTYLSTALIGPGLPPLETGMDLPFEIPDDCVDCGVVVRTPTKVPLQQWNERPVMRLTDTPGVEIAWFFPIPENMMTDLVFEECSTPGTYYVVIWNPTGRPCDYTANLGLTEHFTDEDLLRNSIVNKQYSHNRLLHVSCPEFEGPAPFETTFEEFIKEELNLLDSLD